MEQTQQKKKKVWRVLKRILLSFVLLFLSVIIIVGLYAYSKFSKLGDDIHFENVGNEGTNENEKLDDEFTEDDIIINDIDKEEVGVGYTNFVLFGADSRSNDVTYDLNTDTIIVVSLNNATKEIKLLSVYRDTLLDLTNGSIQKCNSAYRKGGPKQAINMLNMNLDLDIQKYVTVNFSVVSDVIDMLGGIEVNVTEAERKAVNKYLKETAKVTGKEAVYLTKAGLQTLDGVQATTYARIRKGVGNDYGRTERQRELITLTLQKAIKADFATINKIIDKVFPNIATNFSFLDVLKYAKDLTKYKIIESSGFPFKKGDGSIPGKGSCVYAITLESNVQKLHEFLYGTLGYQPSNQVISISQEIKALVDSAHNNSQDNTSSQEETKPDNGENTGAETKPEDGGNTGNENQPENSGNTGSESQPENGGNTGNESQPENGENIGSENQPENSENTGSENTDSETTLEGGTVPESDNPTEDGTSFGNHTSESEDVSNNETLSENKETPNEGLTSEETSTINNASVENTTTEE